jgi:hypothetical protein
MYLEEDLGVWFLVVPFPPRGLPGLLFITFGKVSSIPPFYNYLIIFPIHQRGYEKTN